MRILFAIAILMGVLIFAGCVSEPPAVPPNSSQIPPTVQQPAGLANGSLEQFKARGNAVECDGTVTVGSKKDVHAVYVMGEKSRWIKNGISSLQTFDLILDGKYGYYRVEGQNSKGCSWTRFDSSTKCYKDGVGMISTWVEMMKKYNGQEISGQKISYECKDASFGEQEFVPDGKVCDIAVDGECRAVTASSDLESAKSEIYWQNAQPFSIASYSQAGSMFTMNVRNAGVMGDLTINGIALFDETGAAPSNEQAKLKTGEAKQFEITLSNPCTAGGKYRYSINISFTDQNGVNITQYGKMAPQKDSRLIGICG